MGGYTYILSSGPYGTLYVGISNSLSRRVWEHKESLGSAFCRKYGITQLVHYEFFEDITDAIHREKRLKKWNRAWKIALIEKNNPDWKDLYLTLNGGGDLVFDEATPSAVAAQLDRAARADGE